MSKANTQKPSGETPRYRLLSTCYVNEQLIQVRDGMDKLPEIDFVGVPGSYMEPLNDAARAMVEKYRPRSFDIDKAFATPPKE